MISVSKFKVSVYITDTVHQSGVSKSLVWSVAVKLFTTGKKTFIKKKEHLNYLHYGRKSHEKRKRRINSPLQCCDLSVTEATSLRAQRHKLSVI